MMSNNIAPITLGPILVMQYPSNWTEFVYSPLVIPAGGCGVSFTIGDDEDTKLRSQAFIIYETDGSGPSIQAGTLSRGMLNFGIIGAIKAGEIFTVADTNGATLLGVTGDGQTKLNKISRVGASPTVAVNANAGTGATVVMTPGGTDSAFKLLVTAGSAALVGGTWFTVTFATPFLNVPIVMAAASDTGFNNIWTLGLVRNATVNGFDWWVNTVPAAGQVQGLSFIAIG